MSAKPLLTRAVMLVCFSAVHLVTWAVAVHGGLFFSNHLGFKPGLHIIVFMSPALLLSGPFVFMSLGVIYFVSWELADLPGTLANCLLYGLLYMALYRYARNRPTPVP